MAGVDAAPRYVPVILAVVILVNAGPVTPVYPVYPVNPVNPVYPVTPVYPV